MVAISINKQYLFKYEGNVHYTEKLVEGEISRRNCLIPKINWQIDINSIITAFCLRAYTSYKNTICKSNITIIEVLKNNNSNDNNKKFY